MSRYSNEEIATRYSLWMEYVDPSGIDTEEAFDAMSIERKISIIETCFPESKSKAAQALRAINSPAQQQAARKNGKKGGRPAFEWLVINDRETPGKFVVRSKHKSQSLAIFRCLELGKNGLQGQTKVIHISDREMWEV
jgi:hypothetical protein